MIRCAYVFTTVYRHDVCVCGGWGWGCLSSVSGPMCIFVFVIGVTLRRLSLPSKDKNKVLKSMFKRLAQYLMTKT